jgi:hypothetical protein
MGLTNKVAAVVSRIKSGALTRRTCSQKYQPSPSAGTGSSRNGWRWWFLISERRKPAGRFTVAFRQRLQICLGGETRPPWDTGDQYLAATRWVPQD